MRNEIVFERAAPAPDFFASVLQDFHHPSEVLDHPGFPVSERPAIFAGWASDAHAVENALGLRQLENGVRIPESEILSALKRLDERPSRRGDPSSSWLRDGALARLRGFACG